MTEFFLKFFNYALKEMKGHGCVKIMKREKGQEDWVMSFSCSEELMLQLEEFFKSKGVEVRREEDL